MKTLLISIGLLVAVNSYCQKYNIGIVKTGSNIKNIEGQIIVTDSTVTTSFDGQSSTLKITSRKGYTIHVTDGTLTSRYVVSHAAGRLHGFTYDRHITYHPEKHHPSTRTSVYYCLIQRN